MKIAAAAALLVVICLQAANAVRTNSEAAIAFGNRHAVALRTNGEVLTWGENVYCQLGRGSQGQLRAHAGAGDAQRRRRSRRPPITRWC